MSGMAAPPESTKNALYYPLVTHTRQRWPQVAEVDVRQHEALTGRARLPGMAGGGEHRFQRPSSLVPQNLTGRSQTNVSTAAFQQPDTEPLFKVPDRLRQHRLGDHEPRGSPPEVQFLGDGEEVVRSRVSRRSISPAISPAISPGYRPAPDRCWTAEGHR